MEKITGTWILQSAGSLLRCTATEDQYGLDDQVKVIWPNFSLVDQSRLLFLGGSLGPSKLPEEMPGSYFTSKAEEHKP